ncbi:MAG: hypothetical protein RLZZ245_877 [Verrucomicrobiota bacterium]|jgi:hypothetical protein
MNTQSSSSRTELDLMTERKLARYLKVCRRQLNSLRVGRLSTYFKWDKERQ